MSQNNNLLLGLGLIVGAVYYSRRATAATSAAAAAARGPLGTGSVPGSVGTGVAQSLGGILGNLLSPKSGGGTSTGAPVTNTSLDNYPTQVQDGVISNNVDAADPMGGFDPSTGMEPTEFGSIADYWA